MGGPGHVYPLVQKNSTACSRDGLRKEKKKLVLVEADAEAEVTFALSVRPSVHPPSNH
jgi:hypothetical protein